MSSGYEPARKYAGAVSGGEAQYRNIDDGGESVFRDLVGMSVPLSTTLGRESSPRGA